jgi:cell migration-inducing and hyaluronan-binding protein
LNSTRFEAVSRLARSMCLAIAGLSLALVVASSFPGTAAADQGSTPFQLPRLGQTPNTNTSADSCNGAIQPNRLGQGGGNSPGQVANLVVNTSCTIQTGGSYYYDQINIVGPNGSLKIMEPKKGDKDINIWASSIIVENGGELIAGKATAPYGSNGGTLTFFIYGANQSVDASKNPVDPSTKPALGALCHGKLDITKEVGPCGIPWKKVWGDNGLSPTGLDGGASVGGVTDYFYQYGPLYGDNLCSDGKTVWDAKTQCNNATSASNQVSYFGDKVLAVSYGGTLELFGYKGTPLKAANQDTGNGLSSLTTSRAGTGAAGTTAQGSGSSLEDRLRQLLLGQGGGGSGGSGGENPPPPSRPQPGCATAPNPDLPTSTGCSWLRLAGDLNGGESSLTLSADIGDRWWRQGDAGDEADDPKLAKGDRVVVTTTDYLPGHSEELTIKSVSGKTITFNETVKWSHSGTVYGVASRIPGDSQARLLANGMDADLINNGAETRAAVALLTRSIRIVSAGDKVGETFEAAGSDGTNCKANPPAAAPVVPYCYYFGAHVVFRQGFKEVHVQGVEFKNLGQGGKLGHYPVHFHMARQVPAGTFIKDSSIYKSMTRWIVLHSTQGVLLQRNVGYKSIGHGFYLEDGTETDNQFYSNLGVFAQAAIDNAQNPRKVPGILADSQSPWQAPVFTAPNVANPGFPFRSDAEYPTAFWITNGWNDFVGNMAAGSGACGSGFWFVPMVESDMADVPTGQNAGLDGHMKWTKVINNAAYLGYAGLQHNAEFEASTPLRTFYKNSTTSTMMAFQTTTDAPSCDGFIPPDATQYPPPGDARPAVVEIRSYSPPPKRITVDVAPNPPHTEPDLLNTPYYPHTHGLRHASVCPVGKDGKTPDCNLLAQTCGVADGSSCTVTVIDHLTSSFTWANGNVSAVWLRPQWYLLDNAVLTDPQNGAVTFITGGDFTHASVIPGYWAVMLSSVLVGHTQAQDTAAEKQAHKFSLDIGPVNSYSGLKCDALVSGAVPGYCLVAAEGVSFPIVSYFVNQRMFNIYDGPAYQDSNAYLDITPSTCKADGYNGPGGCMYGSTLALGVPKDPSDGSCYLPNAAIGWKQPNGFFYPPAFHSSNLFFGNVAIRHYVINPLFKAGDGVDTNFDFGQGGSYVTNAAAAVANYCTQNELMFNGFTSIDRQTELNDIDGTLTGLSNDLTPSTQPPVVPAALKQTISVNEDAFFTAPVETPECASNAGPNSLPANACKPPVKAQPLVTAKTSPYDYVATVVYHPESAPNWDKTCTNPECYGIPLYRQFLAGDQTTKTREWAHWYANGCDQNLNNPQCRWPFIRMSGEDLGTRETLTVNNGTYFLDTAVPLEMQKDIREGSKIISHGESYNRQGGPGNSIDTFGNVFQPGETYYVFFLYAKKSTRQTYQIYVGKDPNGGSVKPKRVRIPSSLDPTDYDGTVPYLATIDTSKVMIDGIVSVTVDFKDVTELEPTPANGLCKPSKFCGSSDNTTCSSVLSPDDPAVKISTTLSTDAKRACRVWAVKDLDCPVKGCLGFSFTLPDASIFKADATVANPTPHRRQPGFFPGDNQNQGLPNWLVKFTNTGLEPDKSNGQCHYGTLPSYPPPGASECTVPDWVPQ